MAVDTLRDFEVAFDGIDLRGRALAFIGKPFTAEALRRKVRQTLDDETSEKLPL